MLELVFAPAKDWINKSDQDIVDATMEELKKLFPTHFMGDDKTSLRKYKVVKTPRSVYKAVPGCQEFRPSQNSPCLLYTSPSPRDRTRSRMPSSA